MIREARPADVADIASLIHELAHYEHAAGEVTMQPEDLLAALFGPAPAVFAHVAELGGAAAGIAVWFPSRDQEAGPGIYLEDLVVREPARGRGLGRGLLKAVAGKAVASHATHLDWAVLEWNEPALGFYRALGGVRRGDLVPYRLAGAALDNVAARDGRPVAYGALHHRSYSTWTGRHGIFIDAFPDASGERPWAAAAQAAIEALAGEAVAAGYTRVEWAASRGDREAAAFARAVGAVAMTEWVFCRLAGEALHRLAGEAAVIEADQQPR